jgi:hypothetical protein
MVLQDDMFRLIQDWKSSGTKRAEFLKDKKISKDKFSYWVGKYNRLNGKKPGREQVVKSDFKKIVLPAVSQGGEIDKLIEFTIPSGIQIIIYK